MKMISAVVTIVLAASCFAQSDLPKALDEKTWIALPSPGSFFPFS
jgi:hypothetical protein